MNVEVLVGLQAARGTAETNDMFKVSATDYGIASSTDKTISEALGSGRWVRDGFLSKVSVEGDVPVELNMEQMELALHAAGFTGVLDGVNDWKMTPDDTLNKYLTVGVNDLDNNMFEYAKDCLLSSITISATLEAFITGNLNFIGMDYTTENTKYANTTQVLDLESLICLGATIKEAGTDMTSKVESVEMTIDNKLEGKGAMNSVYYKAIRQSDRGNITLGITFNEFDKASYLDAKDKQFKNTAYEVELIYALSSDPTKRVIFTFPKCKVSKNERTDFAGSGGLTKELEAYYDETIKSPVSILFKNYTSIL